MGAGGRRRKIVGLFLDFLKSESSSSLLLLLAAVVGLVWANSPAASSYFSLLDTHLTLKVGSYVQDHSLKFWVNDGLMVLFFLLVGLEIKREILVGELRNPKQALLPAVAALGGMLVPAALYFATNSSGPSAKGWGIPMATDIAFALGVLTALKKRVPVALNVFLAALAIVDDLGAVLVIALFYTAELNFSALGYSALVLGALALLNWRNVRVIWPYAILGVVLWLLIMDSGIHPTIAGVLLAFTFPAKTNLEKSEFKESMDEAIEHFSLEGDDTQSLTERQQESLNVMEGLIQDASMPLERVENFLVGWVSYLIVPIFALCNAGVSLSGGMEFGSPVSIGILLGLVLGKPIGIVLFSLLAIKMKLCAPMLGVNTKQLIATGCIAGIGFTMSLFVAELAFGTSAMLDQAKIAIISASVLSACIGVVFFMMTKPSPTQAES